MDEIKLIAKMERVVLSCTTKVQLESAKRYCILACKGLTIASIEEQLASSKRCRIHGSYILLEN